MNPLILTVALTALAVSRTSHAQTTEPLPRKPYRCQAECYVIGEDGSRLHYAGGKTVFSSQGRAQAFQKLRSFCDYPDLLVRRRLTELTSETHREPVTTTTYQWYRGWRWNTSRQRVTTYTLTNTETRAQFTTEAATEANSCVEIPESELPPFDSLNGETIFG